MAAPARARLPVFEINQPRELSPKQFQLAKLLARGHGFKESAQIMGVELSTAKHHAEEIYLRLGIHSMVELTHLALSRQWVTNLFPNGEDGLGGA